MGPLVYEMTDLIDKKSEVVQARRLLLFRGDIEGHEPRSELLSYAEHSQTPLRGPQAP